jgi:hypothetical protein
LRRLILASREELVIGRSRPLFESGSLSRLGSARHGRINLRGRLALLRFANVSFDDPHRPERQGDDNGVVDGAAEAARSRRVVGRPHE